MSKLWTIKESRVRQTSINRENWAETVFGSLAPGSYRVLPAEFINRESFPRTPEAFAGFPCPYCNQSVLRECKINDYPDIHLYGCGCTAAVIAPPYDELRQWHWVAFVNLERSGAVRLATGGAENSILAGFYHDEEKS